MPDQVDLYKVLYSYQDSGASNSLTIYGTSVQNVIEHVKEFGGARLVITKIYKLTLVFDSSSQTESSIGTDSSAEES